MKQSFIPLLMLCFLLHTYISREGLFVSVSILRAGRPGNFVFVAAKAGIHLRCQAPTPAQAQIASYSMENCSSFLGDEAAGA